MKRLLFSLALLLTSIINHCSGSSSDISYLLDLDLINSKYIRDLLDNDYRALKGRVLHELEGSWCSQQKATLIMDLIVLQRLHTCVEIGVFQGASFLPAAAALSYLEKGDIYAIDPWSNLEATRYMEDTDPNKPSWSAVDLEAVYTDFRNLVISWNLHPHYHIMRLTSEAAAKFITKKIDFLHLDGDYSEQISVRDTELYLPKVRLGGYILFSNRLLTVNNKQPKKAAFDLLLNSCEVVYQMDNGNAILLRKIVD